MSQAKAFGSISIIDITDLGEFWVQPMSNMPLSVIYSPDGNSFTPTWSVQTPLILTPSLWYAGRELSIAGGDRVDVTWQKQEGSNTPGGLNPQNETVTNGVLTVEANQFNENSTMLTYIVTATYTEPVTGQALTSKGQITFTMVKHAAIRKDCKIIGDTIFKYNSQGNIVGASTITLTAQITQGMSFVGWKYYTSNGTWADYPTGTITNLSLDVSASHDVFNNDKCILKAVTNDNNVYDIHTITKLKDGPPGDSTVTAILSNESIMVPFNMVNGELTGDFTKAISQIYIYEGGVDVTSEWTLDTNSINTNGCSITIPYQGSNYKVKVEGFSKSGGVFVNSATVTLTYTKEDYSPVVKTITLVKVTAGADGESPIIYSIEPDTVAINRTADQSSVVYNPSSITFRSYKQIGETKTSEKNRICVYKNITYAEYLTAVNNNQTPTPIAGGTDAESCTYTLSGNDITSLLGILFKEGGTSKVLDYQSVVITKDGDKGEQGNTGEDGASTINVVMGNYSDVLNCNSDNELIQEHRIQIPFVAYEGLTQVGCTVTNINKPYFQFIKTPSGATSLQASVTPSTSNSTGTVSWTLPAGTKVTTGRSSIAIPFTVSTSGGNKTVRQDYSWTRATAAINGENTVLLQIFTPDGTNTFNQNTNSITMKATLMDGTSDGTSDVSTWAWAKWGKNNNDEWGYQNESGDLDHPNQKTVTKDTVDSYASYRCTATYNDKSYTAYFSLFDKTDPIQVSVFSSFGEQIINGQGVGVLYVRVTQLGQEVDQLLSDRFIDGDAPTGATVGDHYYQLNPSDWTATLMEFTSNNEWQPYSTVHSGQDDPPPYKGTYSWVWRDKDGNEIPRNGNYQQITVNGVAKSLPKEGKVVYIDGTMINTKIIADVEVTI